MTCRLFWLIWIKCCTVEQEQTVTILQRFRFGGGGFYSNYSIYICKGDRVIKIGPHLPKLMKKIKLVHFYVPQCIINSLLLQRQQGWRCRLLYEWLLHNCRTDLHSSAPGAATQIHQPTFIKLCKNIPGIITVRTVVQHCINGDTSFLWELLWLYFFFPNRPGGQTGQPIFTQNGLNDVVARKDCTFAIKVTTFSNPWPPDPKNRENLARFRT